MKTKFLWLYLLNSTVYFIQGIEDLPFLSLKLYFKETIHLPPEKIMYISSLITLAWVIKPIWGALCDNFLNSKVWILISLLGSILISLFFGFLPFIPIQIIILLGLLGNWTSAMRDTSVDRQMCVEGKENDNCDKIQTWQWISITTAGILVGVGGGYIAEHFNYQFGYLCLIPFYLGAIWIACKQKSKPVTKNGLLNSLKQYKQLVTNKQFLFACLFLFLYKYSPSFGEPLFFKQRDVFHWSAQWIGILRTMVSFCEIGGALLFYKYCKKLPIQKWLYISVLLGALLTFCYLVYTPITAIFYGIGFAVIGMFVHLISMSFLAKSTINGLEGISFALLCSVNNLSNTASLMTGSFLYPLIGLTPLIILSAVTSLACLLFIKKLNLVDKNVV